MKIADRMRKMGFIAVSLILRERMKNIIERKSNISTLLSKSPNEGSQEEAAKKEGAKSEEL